MKIRLPILLPGLIIGMLLIACSCSLPELVGIGKYHNPTPTLMECGATVESDLAETLITRINELRSTNGLPTLLQNEFLMGAALRHSTDMACNDFVDSVGSDGATWHELMVEGDYLVSYGGIATAAGYADDLDGLIQAWSGGDYSVIMDTTAIEIGAAAVARNGTQYGTYWTVLIALPNR